MTNAFGVVLDNASVRRAALEGVPESVIAAIYLLHERSVDEIAAKLRPDELGHVIRLVSRCPSCYPPGTLEALKIRSPAPSPEPVASISTDRPPAVPDPVATKLVATIGANDGPSAIVAPNRNITKKKSAPAPPASPGRSNCAAPDSSATTR